jgi:hypothetical protein|tara:strand:+ start:93 stop:224 length:132 start_codon:yes stop_codon:yes gene_type:complete
MAELTVAAKKKLISQLKNSAKMHANQARQLEKTLPKSKPKKAK